MILEGDDAINEVESGKLKFITFIPNRIDYSKMTVRVNDRKWDTVRYFITFNGMKLRIKEFFMDWFYTGFPKSLLSSFIGTYSPVEHIITGNGILFCGKNYRGNDSASIYIQGTQIEIESTIPASLELFGNIASDLIAYPGVKFNCHAPFHERSFFAQGNHGDWFEDERISRMSWREAKTSIRLKVGDTALVASSTGSYGDSVVHRILVLQDNCFSNVSWIDFCTYPNNIEHSFYKLRQEGSLFDNFIIEGDRKFVYRNGSGPALYQFYSKGYLYTMSFSPGIPVIGFNEMESMEEDIVSTSSTAFSPIQ